MLKPRRAKAERQGLFYDPSRLQRAGLSQTKQRYALFIFIFTCFAKQALHASENKNAPHGALFGLRRDRDSNPGYSCPYNGFRDRPIQPLWHLSLYQPCKSIFLCLNKTGMFNSV